MILEDVESCANEEKESDPATPPPSKGNDEHKPPADEPPCLQGEPPTANQDTATRDTVNRLSVNSAFTDVTEATGSHNPLDIALGARNNLARPGGGIGLGASSAAAGSLASRRVTLPSELGGAYKRNSYMALNMPAHHQNHQHRSEHGREHHHKRDPSQDGSSENHRRHHHHRAASNEGSPENHRRHASDDGVDSPRDHSKRMCMWMKRDDVRDELQTLKDSIGQEVKELRHLIKEDIQEVFQKCAVGGKAPLRPRVGRANTQADAAVERALRPSVQSAGAMMGKISSLNSAKSHASGLLPGVGRMDSVGSGRSYGSEDIRFHSDGKRQQTRRSEKPSTIPEAAMTGQLSIEKDLGLVPMRPYMPEEAQELAIAKAMEKGTSSGGLGKSLRKWSKGKPAMPHANTLNDLDKVDKKLDTDGEPDAVGKSFSLTGKARTMPLNDEAMASSAGAVNGFKTFEASDVAVIPNGPAGNTDGKTFQKSSSKSKQLEEVVDALRARGQHASKCDCRRCSFKCTRASVLLIIEDSIFDYVISSCIMLNAVIIGAQSDFQIKNLKSEPPGFFDAFERFFFVVFTCELVLRLYGYRWTFFYNNEWKWNWFDFFIVSLQLAEEVLGFFNADSGTKIDEMSDNVNFIRVLRILRLVRVLRLVRLLRFVAELRAMVCSILGSFKSLCWTIVLLMLMIYVASVYLIQLIVDLGQSSPETYEEETVFQEFYGSIPRAVLTLFQAMTGGVDWNELVVPLMDHISPLMAIVFSLYIAFAVLAMMNVITGVFVESALLTAKEDKEHEMVIRVRRLFRQADEDGSGTISWEEFMTRISDPEMVKYFKALEIDVSEARGLFQLLDTDGSGEVSAEEFVMGCVRLRGPAKAIDLATMMYFNKRISARWRAHMSWIEDELEEMYDLLEAASSWIWSLVCQGDMENGHPTLVSISAEPGGLTSPESAEIPRENSSNAIKDDSFLRISLENGRQNATRSSRNERRERIHDEDDGMYATWADLKAQGRRKASIEAMQPDDHEAPEHEKEADEQEAAARGSITSVNARASEKSRRSSLLGLGRKTGSMRSSVAQTKDKAWNLGFSSLGKKT